MSVCLQALSRLSSSPQDSIKPQRRPRKRFISAWYGPQYRAQVLFSGYVGLRPGELFALRREDINGAFCNIERSLSKTGEIGLPKNGKARIVTIPPSVREALRDVPVHASGLLFSSPRDRMWNQATHHRY